VAASYFVVSELSEQEI